MNRVWAGESLEGLPAQNRFLWNCWLDFCEMRAGAYNYGERVKSPRWRAAKRFLSLAWVTTQTRCQKCPWSG